MNARFYKIMGKFFLGVFLTLVLSWCVDKAKDPPKMDSNGSENIIQDIGTIDNTHGLSELDMARRRVALRSIIRKGDYYSARNNATLAVENYEKAFDQIKEDPKIALRLANAYLELKNFHKAAEIFVKFDLSNFDEPSKLKVIASIMLDNNRDHKKDMIYQLGLTDGTKAYLGLVDDCTNAPNDCIKSIQSSTSTDYQIQALRETIQSAKGTSDDELYIQTLLLGKLFEQKAYLAVKKMGSEILQIRPNYKVVLKIVGYSDYELGNYSEAAKNLEQYYSLEPKDVEVAYMLGVVNYYKSDFSTSNLYFNSAVLNGYTPKTELERRLVYNYVLLWDTTGAFKIFRFLLDENDVLPEDYHIALFIAEQGQEYSKVSIWSKKWLQKFPDDAILYAYAGAALIRSLDLNEAEQSLLLAYKLDSKQPIVLLELGRLYIQKLEYSQAQEYLNNTIGIDQGWYFATEAEKLLAQIPVGEVVTNTGGSIVNMIPSDTNTSNVDTWATITDMTAPVMDTGSEPSVPEISKEEITPSAADEIPPPDLSNIDTGNLVPQP